MKSRKVQILLAVLIGVTCLVLFICGMDWKEVIAAIAGANYGWVLAAVFIGYLSMLIRAIRWQSFLGDPKVTIGKLFLIMNIGFMGNGVFPARMGELIRPFLAGRYTDHRFSKALATIVVERIFDLLGLLVILAYVFYVFPFPIDPASNTVSEEIAALAGTEQSNVILYVKEFAKYGVFAFIILFSAIGVLTYAPNWSLKVSAWMLKPLPVSFSSKLLHMIKSFEDGASTLRRPLSFLFCLALTLLLWLTIAYSELLILWAFGVTEVGFNGALFFMVGLCFAVMFPQLPGYIGVYQGAAVLLLTSAFLVDKDIAGAVALVMWFSQVPPVIILGFVSLLIMGISFREISHVREEIPSQESEGAPLAVESES